MIHAVYFIRNAVYKDHIGFKTDKIRMPQPIAEYLGQALFHI